MVRFTTCLAENTEPLCRHLTSFIQAELDIPIQFVNDISWGEREKRLAAGSIQMGWICGLLFARLRAEANAPLHVLAAPIMLGNDDANRPVYFSRLVVRQDSPYRSFADLRGVRWGYNDPGSFSGYAIVRHHLAQLGETDRYFGAWLETGGHFNSVEHLLNGRIDAAAIDSTVWDYLLQQEPLLADKIRLIGSFGPNPSPPLVVSEQIPASQRQQLRQLLLTLHKTSAGQAILASSGVREFTAVSNHAYQPLYKMSQAATASEPTSPI